MSFAHSYIVTPGIWNASGRYWDEQNREVAAEGWAEIRHHADICELVGEMRLLGPSPVAFTTATGRVPRRSDASMPRPWMGLALNMSKNAGETAE